MVQRTVIEVHLDVCVQNDTIGSHFEAITLARSRVHLDRGTGILTPFFGLPQQFCVEFTYLEPQKSLGGNFWTQAKFRKS